MTELDAASLGQLIIGPGIFVLGAFFVMLPFVAVRVFGVALTAYAATSGALSADVMSTHTYLLSGLLALIAVSLGAYGNYRLTRGRIKQFIKENQARALAGRELLVPYAKDGTWYHPGLVYADGRYRVGPRTAEVVVGTYTDALQQLRQMPVACWRRPSPRSGFLGMVSASHWSQPPETARQHLLHEPDSARPSS
jgi:hypothetical protein